MGRVAGEVHNSSESGGTRRWSRVARREDTANRARAAGRGEGVGSQHREDGGGGEESCDHSGHRQTGRSARLGVTTVVQMNSSDECGDDH